ncbi:hypothetical protein ACT3CE_18200 [Marinifilum sp. RC60d5]|uniref:hypothetical protein n=1 Tax=Marinifilum sp. RC60d5 TaxID=3458414 RepID=UPI0040360506
MRNRKFLKGIKLEIFVFLVIFIFFGCKDAVNAKKAIPNVQNTEDLVEKYTCQSTETSFTISCGSGCSMIYYEHSIVSNEVTFKVEMYVNEILTDENLETYIIECDGNGNATKVYLKGEKDNILQSELPMMREEFQKYGNFFCSRK